MIESIIALLSTLFFYGAIGCFLLLLVIALYIVVMALIGAARDIGRIR